MEEGRAKIGRCSTTERNLLNAKKKLEVPLKADNERNRLHRNIMNIILLAKDTLR